MRCKEIERLLSEYVDGILDDRARTPIDKHLLTCSNCKAKLESLKTVVNEISALPPVYPPADFLDVIHDRIETDSQFKRILKKLFIPFRIKIPLEFATAAVLGILIFLIINTQQIRDIQVPIVGKAPLETAERRSNKSDTYFAHESLKKVSPTKPKMSKTLQEPADILQNEPILLTLLIHPKGSDSKQMPLSEMDSVHNGGKESAPPEKMKRRTMQLTDSDRFGEFALEEADRGNAPSREVEDAIQRIKELTTQVEGATLSTPEEKDEALPQSLRIEIPTRDYNYFVNQLSEIADFQSPPPQVSSKGIQKLQVDIRFRTLP
ncbi:MAG: DUF2275 domain-containing protein [Thermodesulfobacteriota bacterium]|nr:DUF2275 domain-containing protein [Thermodesulfobacteriota bacterium]